MLNVLCMECGTNETEIILGNEKTGFARTLQLICHYCERSGLESKKKSTCTSTCIEIAETEVHDINLRMTLLYFQNGQGYPAVQNLSMILNTESLGKTNFYKYSKFIQEKVISVAEDMLKKSRETIRKAYLDARPGENIAECEAESGQIVSILNIQDNQQSATEDFIDMAVSFDGSWLTRGFKSQFGFAAVIDICTGYVVDYTVPFKNCRVCSTIAADLGKDSPEFYVVMQGHQSLCDKNHDGSSGSMESAAAEILWTRSVDYNLRYTSMLSDGDAKSFIHLTNLNVYGETIEINKEECVNHVGKR